MPQYRHVINGVCFRCWGAGTEPYTPSEIMVWLEKARAEYRERRESLKEAKGKRASFLRAELALIEEMGKAANARLKRARTALVKRGGTRMVKKPLAYFQSYSSDDVYEIRAASDDGSLYCSCPSWKYQRKHPKDRTCKHIEAFKRTRDRKKDSEPLDVGEQLRLMM